MGMASNLFVGHCILVLGIAQTAPVGLMDQLVWLTKPVNTGFQGQEADLPLPDPGAGSLPQLEELPIPLVGRKKFIQAGS